MTFDASSYGIETAGPRVVSNDDVWILKARLDRCPECDFDPDVVAFACDAPTAIGDDGEPYDLGGYGRIAILGRIDRLPRKWLTAARKVSKSFANVGNAKRPLFQNRCPRCHAPIPDSMLSSEPGQVFWPTDEAAFLRIARVQVPGEFEARCWTETFPSTLSEYWAT